MFAASTAIIARAVAAVTLTAAAALSPSTIAHADPPATTVTVTGGQIRGLAADGVREYLGIPYASAARFAAPKPAPAWAGVRDATAHGPQCPQSPPLPYVPALQPSSEDCLSIDLYVPENAGDTPLPVMVWLYGGGFVLGSNAQYDSPTRLVREGRVIVAVPNYRVGPFGFLALPELAREGAATGTYGTLDQQAALRWVRDNAAAFGGDPANVTLMGESAGGMSVCTQLASPGARGLYAKAIVQSGACARSPLVPPSLDRAYQRSQDYAASLGCGEAATRLDCLRAFPVERLLDSPTTRLDRMDITWTPVRDGVVVTDTPEAAFSAGAVRQIPMIVGSNADEGATFLALTDYAQGRNPDAEDYTAWARHLFGANAPGVLARYPVGDFENPAAAKEQVITDGFFACPALFTTAAAQRGGATVWQYRFTDSPLPDNPLLTGAFHASDVLYLFSSLQGIPIPLDPRATALAHRIQDSWARFAHTGSPRTPAHDGWRPWQPADPTALELTGAGIEYDDDFTAVHRCDLWNDIAGIG
ncbi:carboxylesterase/lipase family protein [Nocardia takedensis]|uniref:carboxylesterase/lipase family protein n=1 Tax=Nocardia takedensis TaxID=259390 RepID=UPI003F774D29